MKSFSTFFTTIRIRILISLIVVIPFGFATKIYHGPGELWFHNYCGAILYEIFWCLVIFLFSPTSSPLCISLSVFAATSVLEFLQLWHPPFLELIRRSFFGRALIGTTFIWWDFFYYVIGCIIGWLWLKTSLKLQKY